MNISQEQQKNYPSKNGLGTIWFFKSSLRLFLFLLLIVSIIEVGLFLGLKKTFHETNYKNALEQSANSSLLIGQIVEEHFDGIVSYVESYTRKRSNISGSKNVDLLSRDLEELVKQNKFIDRTFVTDIEGNLLTIYPYDKKIIGKNFAYRAWYTAVQNKKGSLVTDIYQTVVSPHNLVVSIASLYKNLQGETIGYIVCQIKIDNLVTWLLNQKLSKEGNILLIDKSGNAIESTAKHTNKLLTLKPEEILDAKKIKGQSGSTSGLDPITKIKSVIGYSSLGSFGWTILVTRPESDVFHVSDSIFSRILFIALIFGIILLVSFFYWLNKMRIHAVEQEQLISKIQVSEKKFRKIFNSNMFGMYFWTSEGNIVDANDTFLNYIGYSREEFFASGMHWSNLTPADYTEYANEKAKKLLSEGRIEPYEKVYIRKDGSRLPILLGASIVEGIPGVDGIAFILDMSKTKQIEGERERLVISEQSALQASKIKSDFLANISHEIRTPMNSIVGMADLLSETQLTDDQQKFVKILKNSSENLLVLINDILDFSKIESSDVKMENIEFNLSQVIDSAIEILAPKAELKKLNFFSQIKVGLPSGLVGDPHRLRQILINLLSNAVKFTDVGEVILKVEQHPTITTPGALLFSVIDTGIGIPKDKITILFERFTQADTSVTRKYGGTGLGLSISRKLVELMGGQMMLESEEGKGSVFKFSLVFETCNQTANTKVFRNEMQDVVVEANNKKLKILLVDDFEDNRVLINLYLKNTPYKIEMAENGQIAVDKYASGNYDIILMDMQMPVMDGYTATRKIRELENEKGLEKAIPIIGLTAYALHEDEGKSLEAGCNIHMIKPVKKLKLLDAIANLTK